MAPDLVNSIPDRSKLGEPPFQALGIGGEFIGERAHRLPLSSRSPLGEPAYLSNELGKPIQPREVVVPIGHFLTPELFFATRISVRVVTWAGRTRIPGIPGC